MTTHLRHANFRLVVCLLALCGLAIPCGAAEQAVPAALVAAAKPSATDLLKALDIRADSYEFDPISGRAVGKGNVLVRYQDIQLTADELEGNIKTKDIAVRGHVTFKRGVFVWKGEEIVGNFDSREFHSGKFEATSGMLYLKGQDAAHQPDRRMVMKQTQISTCEYYDHPHYSMTASRIVHYPNGHFVAYNTVYRAGPVPVLYLPVVWGDTDLASGMELKPGYNSSWGPFLLMAKQWKLSDNVSTKMRLDLRAKTGIGVGNETTINSERSHTETLVYGMNDNNTPETVPGYNRRFASETDRYRARIYSRTDLTDDMHLRLKVDKLSDIDMLENWFRKEYRVDPQPKSFVDATLEKEKYTLSLSARPRVNDFYSELEQLPSLKLQVPRQALGDSGFYYQGESSVTRYDMNWRQFDLARAGALRDPTNYDATRVDSLHMFYYPLKLQDSIEFIPRAGVRMTYYSNSSERPITLTSLNQLMEVDDPNNPASTVSVTNYDDKGGSVLRLTGETGFELTSKYYRTWNDYKSDFWKIDGLRHVVQPYVNYTYAVDPTKERDYLYFFDEVDRLIAQNFVRVGMKQRWQTRRSNRIYTLASMENYADFHFAREDGFEHAGNFGTKAAYNPLDTLSFWGNMLADMGETRFNRGELGMSVGDPKAVRVDLSYLYRNSYNSRSVYSMGSSLTDFSGDGVFAHHYEKNHYASLGFNFALNAKTSAVVRFDYDILGHELARESFELIRDLHCWMGSVKLESDPNVTTLMLVLYLKAYPGFGLGSGL